MSKCEDCKHWARVNRLWGRCELARKGYFLNKTKFCPEGYICQHTDARPHNQKACKRFGEVVR